MKRRFDQFKQIDQSEQGGAYSDALKASVRAFDPANPPSDFTGKENFSQAKPIAKVWHEKKQMKSSEQDDYPGAALKDAYTDIT